MTQDYKHPIAPPPQWRMDWWQASIETMGADVPSILLEVIQWGREQAETDIERKLQKAADQEPEACCEWVSQWAPCWPNGTRPEDELRALRRPEPPSLKERIKQAISSGDTGLAIKLLEDLNDTV